MDVDWTRRLGAALLIAMTVAACYSGLAEDRSALATVDAGSGSGSGSGSDAGTDAGCGDAGDGGCGSGSGSGSDAGIDAGVDGGCSGSSCDAGVDGGADGGVDAGPTDAGMPDAPPDALVCTEPPDALNMGPELAIKVDLKSGAEDGIAGAFVSYELGFELKAKDKAGANACEGTYTGSASGHFKITIGGQIIGAAIKGGVAEAVCKTPVCKTPPKEECAGPGCSQLDGNISASIVRGIEFDLCKKFPFICKFGKVKAVGTVGGGVVGNGNKQSGTPAGSCTNCCENGNTKWSAGVGPQVGAKGKLSLRIQLWKFFVELAGSVTGCATATANLGVDCDGNVAPGVKGYGHFSACIDPAVGAGGDTSIKFSGPNMQICMKLGWWEICTPQMPRCFVDVGNKDLACPGGL